MDPIFDLPADLPLHAEVELEPVKARVLREWQTGTFIENLAVLSDGSIALAVHTSNLVERVDPEGRHLGAVDLPVPPAGLVARSNGGYYVAGGEPGKVPGRLWRVEPDGQKEMILEVPDALFLNGLTPLDHGILLAAESILGRIYALNLKTGIAEVWFSDSALSKITDFPYMPGANGIKLNGGYVYVTNTDRAIVLRIKIEHDGRAGAPELVAEHLRGDDFAFDDEGSMYIATHIENSLVCLSTHGNRKAIAGPDQGMPGSTAVAFGRTGEALSELYVTTTGGVLRPYNRIAQPAKLIRLETSARGVVIPLAN